MSRVNRFGIMLIIIGIFIPLVSYPFTSLNESALNSMQIFAMRDVLYETSIADLDFIIVEGYLMKKSNGIYYFRGRKAIPYRYLVAFGTLLAFFGIGIVALYPDKSH